MKKDLILVVLGTALSNHFFSSYSKPNLIKIPEIKEIKIQGFRGIPKKDLKLRKRNLLLCGETGTGKSSIIEAIEFFFTGELSYFRGEGTGPLTRSHIVHKDFNRDDVKTIQSERENE